MERKKLLQISLKIGVGDSTRFLTKYTGVLARFLKPGGYNPDELVENLAPCAGDLDYDIGGFHVYTFDDGQVYILLPSPSAASNGNVREMIG